MFTNQTCITCSTQYNPNYCTLLSTNTYFQVYVKILQYGKMRLDDTKLRTYGHGYSLMPSCLAMGHKYNICIYCRKISIVFLWAFLTCFSAGSNKLYIYGQCRCVVFILQCQNIKQNGIFYWKVQEQMFNRSQWSFLSRPHAIVTAP